MLASPLSPAEAFVLLNPQTALPSEAFKIAFLALVATGAIKITMAEKSTLFRTRTIPVVSLVGNPPDTLLAAEIIQTIRHARPSSIGLEFPAIAKSAVRQFGQSLLRLKKDFILPALTAQDLVYPQQARLLVFFSRTVHLHTQAGLAEKQRIETTLAEAAFLPALLHIDPAKATAIVLAAGPLLLLVPELKGHYGKLAALDPSAATGADSPDVSSFDTDQAAFDGHHFGSLDFGAFDVGALDLDFGSFDASFDSSFSDSGGDGGHGGGDGGSSH